MRARLVAVALFAVAALPLFAQPVFDEAITVNVVEVPVYVERFGKPVTGLTRDDFELYVAGQRQEIEYFDVLAEGSAQQTDAASAPDVNRRRMFVLLFDTGGSSAQGLERARRNAIEYLAASGSNDTFAVATIGRRGVRFLVPFTTDHLALQRAIGTLTPSEAADPFRLATLDAERTVWREAISGAARLDVSSPAASALGMARGIAPAADSMLAMLRWENEEQYLGDFQMIDDLAGLAERMAPLSGVKHVVLLSERRGLTDMSRIERGARMHERYRDAGVVLDAVDIRPPSAPGSSAINSTPAGGEIPSLLPSDLLFALALETGGTVTSTLEQLQRSNGVTYVLGFRPATGTKKNNSVRVRVKDQPILTEVRYRRSFTLEKHEGGDDPLVLADTLLNDIPQRGVSVDLDVNGTAIAATIPGAELLAQSSAERLPIEVFLYVFDEAGKPVRWNHARIDVDTAAAREFLVANPYTIQKAYHLQPGRYAAKAIVRIPGTDRTGFQRTDFVVQ